MNVVWNALDYHTYTQALEMIVHHVHAGSLRRCISGGTLSILVKLCLYVSFQANHVKCTGKVLHGKSLPVN